MDMPTWPQQAVGLIADCACSESLMTDRMLSWPSSTCCPPLANDLQQVLVGTATWPGTLSVFFFSYSRVSQRP